MAETLVAECGPRTRRCADAREYAHALRPCCRAHVRYLMAEISAVLKKNNLTFWADYGTLLGAVRNPFTTAADYPWLSLPNEPIPPGIVPHDKDADLGVLAKEWPRMRLVLRSFAIGKGFDLLVRGHRASMKMRLSRTNHTNVDLFFWEERKDGTMFRTRYISADAYKGRDFHRDMLYPMSKVDWEGLKLPAPNNPAAFLEMRYGPNWKTPVCANHDGVRRP